MLLEQEAHLLYETVTDYYYYYYYYYYYRHLDPSTPEPITGVLIFLMFNLLDTISTYPPSLYL
jgi:hypothetical protein